MFDEMSNVQTNFCGLLRDIAVRVSYVTIQVPNKGKSVVGSDYFVHIYYSSKVLNCDFVVCRLLIL